MNTIKRWQTVAQVHEPERKKMAEQVFGGDTMPIKSVFPKLANFTDRPNAAVYEMDLAAITPEQRQRLVAALAERFRMEAVKVEIYLDIVGLPILAEEITVTTTDPAMMTFLWD
jgi:hypothetical protein